MKGNAGARESATPVMSQLIPCPNCSRHVRLSANCPFCDTALDAAVLSAHYAPRRGAIPEGSKRAALFALGAGVAAACASPQPAYGSPVWLDPDAALPQVTGTAVLTDTSAPVADESTAGQSSSVGSAAPLDAGNGEVSLGHAIHDAGSSSFGQRDAARPEVGDGAVAMDAGSDGAVSPAVSFDATRLDAGADSGTPDASIGPVSEPTSVALYGAPPLGN
jgi:hypothetical protein